MSCEKKSHCWLLAVSLLLNVLLIGFVAGKATHMKRDWHREPAMSEINLPGEKKAAVQAAMTEFKADGKERRKEIREKREEIVAILTAPEFDEAAFKAKSQELGMMFREGRVQMIDRIAEIAKTMSQEERRELAKFMRRPPPYAGHDRQ